mgnify:CR=1 FL=1
MEGNVKKESFSSLHFHPDVSIDLRDNELIINEVLRLTWAGFKNIEIKEFKYSPEFNVLEQAMKWMGIFEKKCHIKIETIS